jgi:DNA-binding MarR family transcriptional regulator
MPSTSEHPSRQVPHRSKPLQTRLNKEQGVIRKLRIIFGSAKKQSRSVENRCGVSGSQLWALTELRERPGLKVSELANLMTIHLSTASNLLDKLQARELVRRERLDSDQRVVRLYLTAAGQRVVAKAPGPARGVVPDALSTVPRKVLDALDLSLDRLIGKLKIKDQSAKETPLADL